MNESNLVLGTVVVGTRNLLCLNLQHSGREYVVRSSVRQVVLIGNEVRVKEGAHAT